MFWIISAILIVIALAFILPALFRRENTQDGTREQNIAIAKEQMAELERRFEQNDIDQEIYQSSRNELELSLFSDLKESGNGSSGLSKNGSSKVIDTWPVLLLIPLIAIPVYLNLGNLDFTKHLDPKVVAQKAIKARMPLKPDGTPDIEKITNRLKAEMESNPTDPKGWYMLGRSYMLLQRFPEATASFDKSLSLRPDRAETMLSLADALSMDNTGQLEGRPRELVKNALMLEPQNTTALWLSGMAASQAGEYPEAISQWQKVLLFLKDKPNEKTAVSNLIDEAKSRLTPDQIAKQTSKTSQATDKITENTNITEIKVSISLSDSLKDHASPDDYVFIYAKAMSGPPMPLAAVRKQVKNLPLELTLNDDMAMMPGLKLSSFKNVAVGARISKIGQPVPQNGDLFNEKIDVKSGESVSLEINEIYKK
ncbi:MAG: cytochrome c-type biogenesis protein CcmH [Cocleimonas sp.]|jgi:cytochrome c-type biogenesis protein CcmH